MNLDRVTGPSLGECDACGGPIVEGDRIRRPDYIGRILFCYVCGLQFLRTDATTGGRSTLSTLTALERLTPTYRSVLWESHR